MRGRVKVSTGLKGLATWAVIAAAVLGMIGFSVGGAHASPGTICCPGGGGSAGYYYPPWANGYGGGGVGWCGPWYFACSRNTEWTNTGQASNGYFSDAVQSDADLWEVGGESASVSFTADFSNPGYTGYVSMDVTGSVSWFAQIINQCVPGYSATGGTATAYIQADVWDNTDHGSPSNGPQQDSLVNTGSYNCPLFLGYWGDYGGATSPFNIPFTMYMNAGDSYSVTVQVFVQTTVAALGAGAAYSQAFITYEGGNSYLSEISWQAE
jgi:hypothetical protein